MDRTVEEFSSIPALKAACASADNKFFTPGAMRWFQSRIHGGMIGRRYFITSEQQRTFGDEPEEPRLYTVRYAARLKSGGLTIDDLGEFQQYETLRAAQAAARAAADADAAGS